MDPKRYGPHENIYQDKNNGHHDKAAWFCKPLKEPAEKTHDQIKTQAVKDDSYNELISGDIHISKEKDRQDRTESSGKDHRQDLKPGQRKLKEVISKDNSIYKTFDYDANEDRKGGYRGLFKPKF